MYSRKKIKLYRRLKKKVKIRGKIRNFCMYRLTVYKSLKHIYAQVFSSDGAFVITNASSIDREVSIAISLLDNKCKKNVAAVVGDFIAKRALIKGVVNVAFDISGFRYHGRIKSLAESARKGGLVF